MERSRWKRSRVCFVAGWLAFGLLVCFIALIVSMELRAAYRYRQTAAALALVKKIGIGDDIQQWRDVLLRQGASEVPGCYVLRNDDARYAFLERLIGPKFDEGGRHTLLLNLAADIGFRGTSFRAEVCADQSIHRVTSKYFGASYCIRDGSWREASFTAMTEDTRRRVYNFVRPGYAVDPVNFVTLGGGLGIASGVTRQATTNDVERASNIQLHCLVSRQDCHLCRFMPDAWRDGPFTVEWDADRELTSAQVEQAKRFCEGVGEYPDE